MADILPRVEAEFRLDPDEDLNKLPTELLDREEGDDGRAFPAGGWCDPTRPTLCTTCARSLTDLNRAAAGMTSQIDDEDW